VLLLLLLLWPQVLQWSDDGGGGVAVGEEEEEEEEEEEVGEEVGLPPPGLGQTPSVQSGTPRSSARNYASGQGGRRCQNECIIKGLQLYHQV